MSCIGGRYWIRTSGQGAEHLGVCAASVYRLCERGELPRVRVLHAIRVAPADLAALIRKKGRQV